MGHQAPVELKLSFPRLLDRMNLRAQVIGAQEVVGDPERAGGIPL
jgi:hypothetical protein